MAPPHRRRRTVNATELLNRRSRGTRDAGTLVRNNMKVLRALLFQDNRDFIKVWSKSSKSTMMYENGKIYFENYQSCYSCVHTEPQVLYKLPKRSKLEKFEDALLCQSPLNKTLASLSDHKASLLALTANNWLYRLSAETGEELQRVYLSPNHKFRYLGWDVSQEMFYVKSVQNKETSLARQAGITQNTVMLLAIFHVFPLQIVGILEINKKVFGNGITDVVLSQGVLVVSYNNKSVKLYSFEHIVRRYLTESLMLGKQSSLLGGKTVGDVPFGIPVNIQITDCPPVLFEVSCSNNSIQIGGYPWHYIYTPLHKNHKGTHHICSLKDSTTATNGIQNMNCHSLESDLITFHPDDSGRIIHIGPTKINVLKILDEPNSGLPSKVVEDFSMAIHRKNTKYHVYLPTWSATLPIYLTSTTNQPHVQHVLGTYSTHSFIEGGFGVNEKQFSFVTVELKEVVGQPGFYCRNAVFDMGEGWVLKGFGVDVDLGVIGIAVEVEVEMANDETKGDYVADEEEWTED